MTDGNGDLNFRWAYAFADAFSRLGAKTACISPGSRCTPLTLAFTHQPGFQCYSHVDERSAAYFALGSAKASGTPSILICTSGTAGANYFPAVIEAYYSHTPMIICTADRPPELHGRGANQTIDQKHLFGNKVIWFKDVGMPQPVTGQESTAASIAVRAFSKALSFPGGPVHLNFPFRKPLEPAETERMDHLVREIPSQEVSTEIRSPMVHPQDVEHIVELIRKYETGSILIGPNTMHKQALNAILTLAEYAGYPVLADGLSQLRCGPYNYPGLCVHASTLLRSPAFIRAIAPDLILRFGRQPTTHIMNNYLDYHDKAIQVLINATGDCDDATGTLDEVIATNPEQFCRQIIEKIQTEDRSLKREKWLKQFHTTEILVVEQLAKLLGGFDTLFEARIYHELVPLLPEGTHLMVSNSMPVRDFDYFAPAVSNAVRLHFNRGASGIDGILSTAFGIAAENETPTVLVTGDLAFYHDQTALLLYRRYHIPLIIILIHNNGGGIFEMLPVSQFEHNYEEFVRTPHGLDFEPIVNAYDGKFHDIRTWDEFSEAVGMSLEEPCLTVIQVQTAPQKSQRFREEIWKSLEKIMESRAL